MAGDDGSDATIRDIKLKLMENDEETAAIHVAGFIGQLLDMPLAGSLKLIIPSFAICLFWNLALGLPLIPHAKRNFQVAWGGCIDRCPLAIDERPITLENLKMFYGQVTADLKNIKKNGGFLTLKN